MANNFDSEISENRSSGDRSAGGDRVKIEFFVNPEDPNLLEGLEQLIRLGILSDRQILHMARRSLACQYVAPQVEIAPVVRRPETIDERHLVTPVRSQPPRPQLVPNLLTSLMAEISVVWLLFLGVFLVVASSAALAAIQWRNFAAVGQYGILWLYTLAFGGAGLWAETRDNLKLTGRMLQIAALLIIPVNFWMMDGFALWAEWYGWVMVAIATVTLGGLQWRLLQGCGVNSRWNSLLLNGLQWGWSLVFVPVLFTYVGTIVTAFVQAIAQRSRNVDEDGADRSLPAIAIAFATLLLVGRAILVKGVPISRFGLAIAIIGWLVYWLYRRPVANQAQQTIWLQSGAALLGLGWLVSYLPDPDLLASGFDPLWQTLAISGLAIWVLWDRLHQRWEAAALVGLWAIGLQTYTLLRVVIPPSARQTLMDWIASWANLQSGAWEMTGLGFFSYIVISLGFVEYLKRRNQVSLANQTELLTLFLGVGLAVPSLVNPLVRSVYFTLSAIVLSVLWLRQKSTTAETRLGNLVYLAHTTGAIAVVSWILWLFPRLSTQEWAWILLVGALVEWAFAAVSRDRFWQNSAWLLGLAQATCAYPLLLDNLKMDGRYAYAGLPWLLVPIALTGLAYVPRFAYGTVAVGLSVGSLILSLVITFTSLNPLLIALFVGTGVMFANSVRLRQFFLAFLTMGFGLLYLGLQTWSGLGKPEPKWYLVGVAIALWLVWILRDGLVRWARQHDAEEYSLPHLYYVAANGWGRGLGIFMGVMLGALVLLSFHGDDGLPWGELLLAGVLSFSAIAYRVWQEPTDLGLWGLAIGAEILVNMVAELIDAPLDYRVLVTLLLGLGTQWIGEVWLRRNSERPVWSALNGVPGAYAALTLAMAHTTFGRLTGLYTIAASLILILIGRRAQQCQWLSYFGLVGISIGAYESVIYLLSRASGGSFGDGITILASVSAVLALIYQAFSRQIATAIRVSGRSLLVASSLHWGLGSLIALMAWPAGLSGTGTWVWCGVNALLVLNVLWQGRSQAAWIYPGFVQLVLTIGLLLSKLLPLEFLNQWSTVFASIFSYIVFSVNWEKMGWQRRPWQISAMVLPVTIAAMTANEIGIPALLLAGAFYGVYAGKTGQIRLSYVGVGLAVWGLFKWLMELGVADPIWYAAVLCLAVLFVVEVEPDLQVNSAKETRHIIRCFALGLFCTTLFYDPWNVAWLRGALTILVAFLFCVLGLVRRTRAYLYIGTMTFMLGVLRMLWLFVSDYSLLLWAVGIALGLMLIWIAATFEARRSQAIALVEYWLRELEAWE
jgi:hypothetical protein